MNLSLNKIQGTKDEVLEQLRDFGYLVQPVTEYSFIMSKKVWFGKEIILLEFDEHDDITTKITRYEYTGIFKFYHSLKWKLIKGASRKDNETGL